MMHASRIVAPFAVATLVAGAVPALEHSQAGAFTSVEIALTHATEHLSDGYSGPWSGGHDHEDGDFEDWGGHGGSQNWWGGGFNLDLSGLLATIVEQLTANNGALLTAIQTAVSAVISDLASGSTIAEALANAGQQLASAIGGNVGSAIQEGLDKIGQLLTIAPKLISGALTIAAALPNAVAPVVTAVTAAVSDVLGAIGTTDLSAVIQTGIKNVTTAVAQGISTITAVIQKVLTGQTATATAATAVLRTAGPSSAEDAVSTPVVDKENTQAPEAEAAEPTKNDTEASDDDSESSAPAKAGSARTTRTAAAAATGAKKESDSSVSAGAEKSSSAAGGSARASGKRGGHKSAD